jgi:hypothetical protein
MENQEPQHSLQMRLLFIKASCLLPETGEQQGTVVLAALVELGVTEDILMIPGKRTVRKLQVVVPVVWADMAVKGEGAVTFIPHIK